MTEKRQAYFFRKEPSGRDYKRLLLSLYPYGERLILASRMSAPLSDEALEIDEKILVEGLPPFTDLAPHILHAEFRTRWPGTQLYYCKGGNLVYEFACNDQTIQTILTHTTKLYEFEKEPFRLEDLSIIRQDGMELLGTTSHERLGILILSDDEHQDLLKQVPRLRLKKGPEDWLEDYKYWWEPFDLTK